jgi:sodium/pantothenate symporter
MPDLTLFSGLLFAQTAPATETVLDPELSAGYGVMLMLCLLIAASVWLGTVAQRVVDKGSFLKGYFLGNRGLGAWALALTATVQSGGTFMGFPALVYRNGWVVTLWIAAYMVVPISGFAIIGKRFAQLSRRTGAITVPDMFRARFGSSTAGLVASLLILLFMTIMMVGQFKAGAIVMKIAWPGSGALAFSEDAADGLDRYYYYGLAIFTATVVGYTLIGGFLAAVWTDLFQSVIMWIGVMILLPLTLIAVGGIGAATDQLRTEVAFEKVSKEDREARLPARQASHEHLRELFASLEQFAGRNDGRLPSDLSELGANAKRLSVDPVTGKAIGYSGAGLSLAPPNSPRRTIVATTPPDEAGWQSVLYSNGNTRSGIISQPGELITGPGPFNWLPLATAISFFFTWVFAGLGSTAGTVRVMATKSTNTLRRSIVLLGGYNLCIYIPLILICISGRALIPDLPPHQSDEIVPRMALLTTRPLPGGSLITGLILSAPFGAVMATVSSYLVVIASGLVRDVYQRFINPEATPRELKRLAYLVMVVVGAIGLAANIDPVDYLQTIVVLSGTCGATSFVVPYLMMAYWRRATAAGAIAGMLVGAAITLTLYVIGTIKAGQLAAFRPYDYDPIILGLAGSLIAGVAVSLLTPRPDPELVSRMFDAEDPAPA